MYASLMSDLIGIHVTVPEQIQLAKRCGFAGVDLRLTDRLEEIQSLGVDRTLDLIQQHGLRVGYGSMLTRTISAVAEDWRAAMEHLPEVATVAEGLGFTRAGVVVLPFDDHCDAAANRARHIERLGQAAPILADHGIALGLEYVSPQTRRQGHRFEFVHNLEQMLLLIQEADQPNVGLMLDSFHWHAAGESAEALAQLVPEHVVVVHLNDAPSGLSRTELDVRVRELPASTGEIDLAGFLGALRDIGYEGPVTSEPTHPRWEETPAEQAATATGLAMKRALSLPTSSTQ